jgi:hypothetical protein
MKRAWLAQAVVRNISIVTAISLRIIGISPLRYVHDYILAIYMPEKERGRDFILINIYRIALCGKAHIFNEFSGLFQAQVNKTSMF